MERTGSARWEGDLKQGKGTLNLGSGAFSGPYSFATRFGNTPGTNPEELIGAAHAACYSMAFANGLAQAGAVARSVETTASVRLEMVGGGFEITGIDLTCHVDVPGLAAARIQQIGEETKKNCPVSKALAAVPITVHITTPPG